MEYKLFPYLFMPGTTIEAVIKHFNDYKLEKSVLDYLVVEFGRNNPKAFPPKAGQSAMIPVLLQYCERHEPKRVDQVGGDSSNNN